MNRSKRYRKSAEGLDRNETYDLPDAIERIKGMPSPKFDETIEVSVKLGIDPRQSDQLVRGSYSLPKGIGKSMRVIVFAEGDKADAAREAGAIEVGGQDLVKKIEDGFLDFDVAIAAPEMMRLVGRLGRTLVPRASCPHRNREP